MSEDTIQAQPLSTKPSQVFYLHPWGAALYFIRLASLGTSLVRANPRRPPFWNGQFWRRKLSPIAINRDYLRLLTFPPSPSSLHHLSDSTPVAVGVELHRESCPACISHRYKVIHNPGCSRVCFGTLLQAAFSGGLG